MKVSRFSRLGDAAHVTLCLMAASYCMRRLLGCRKPRGAKVVRKERRDAELSMQSSMGFAILVLEKDPAKGGGEREL
jgi:hypothetical protein